MNRIRILTLYSVTTELPVSHHSKQAMDTSNFLNDFGSNFQRFKFSSLTNRVGDTVYVPRSVICNEASVWLQMRVL